MKRSLIVVFVIVAARVAPAQEHLEIVARDGRPIAVLTGDASSVAIPPPLEALLYRPDAQVRLTHNHPHGVGLSADDLAQLAKPGVDAIEAVGSDGSRYEAARGPRFEVHAFFESTYRLTERAAREQLARLMVADAAETWRLLPHLVALALERNGTIAYRARLADEAQTCYRRHFAAFGRVIELAAATARRP